MEITCNNFSDSKGLVKRHESLDTHTERGAGYDPQIVWLPCKMVSTTVCHSPVKTPSPLHVSIQPLLTGEMSCGSCTLSSLL